MFGEAASIIAEFESFLSVMISPSSRFRIALPEELNVTGSFVDRSTVPFTAIATEEPKSILALKP